MSQDLERRTRDTSRHSVQIWWQVIRTARKALEATSCSSRRRRSSSPLAASAPAARTRARLCCRAGRRCTRQLPPQREHLVPERAHFAAQRGRLGCAVVGGPRRLRVCAAGWPSLLPLPHPGPPQTTHLLYVLFSVFALHTDTSGIWVIRPSYCRLLDWQRQSSLKQQRQHSLQQQSGGANVGQPLYFFWSTRSSPAYPHQFGRQNGTLASLLPETQMLQ